MLLTVVNDGSSPFLINGPAKLSLAEVVGRNDFPNGDFFFSFGRSSDLLLILLLLIVKQFVPLCMGITGDLNNLFRQLAT